MTASNLDQNSSAIAKMNAGDKSRLVDRATGMFLHWSGTKATKDINQAWLGFARQAQKLKERIETSGADFPYVLIHRDKV